MTAVPKQRRAFRRQVQRGIVMWIAMVVLIVMSLAGLAMMRQMGSGMSIAGNVAFKENATSSADAGTEAARAWLMAQTALVRESDALTQGYHATWTGSVDPTQWDWSNAQSVPVAIDAGQGNNSRYQIHRLCANTGSVTAATQTCSDVDECKLPNAPAGCNKGAGSYNDPNAEPNYVPYYRVTVQTTGPRNTISYTQVILQ